VQQPVESRTRRKLLVTGGVLFALIIFTAVSWLFGGLRAVSRPIPAQPANTWIDQGRFRVQVLGARAGLLEAGLAAKKENTLVVRMRVTNTADESATSGEFGRGITAQSGPGRPANRVRDSEILVSGGSEGYFHPRMPVQVDLIWPLPKDLSLPRVTIALKNWEYVENPFGGSDPYWAMTKDSPTIATVTLPVQQGATS
jgi:hypothetical protein